MTVSPSLFPYVYTSAHGCHCKSILWLCTDENIQVNQGHEFCSALHLLNIIMCCFWHMCMCKITPHKNAYKDDRSRIVNQADCQLLLFFVCLFFYRLSATLVCHVKPRNNLVSLICEKRLFSQQGRVRYKNGQFRKLNFSISAIVMFAELRVRSKVWE